MQCRKIVEMPLGVFCHVEQKFGALKAKLFLGIFRPPALPGAELPTITAGAAIAKMPALYQRHRDTGRRKTVGCLQPGVTTTDDRHID
ncbi:hypothetical protein D3C80_653670 [compost metagenome]